MRVSLFVTCFNDTYFPATGRAAVRLLEALGHEVEFREEQTCCGQLHLNTGYREEALRLAERFAAVFAGAETIVCPSASCVAMVREGYPALSARAAQVAPRVVELSELLGRDAGALPRPRRRARVCYHPTCHSLRSLHVGEAPLRLLERVDGLELVPLDGAQECCGFGGTFAVKNAAVSSAMLADKLDRIERSGADVVTALDNSCLMHIGGGLRRRRSPVRAVHVAELLVP